jgi:hypothetical protein
MARDIDYAATAVKNAVLEKYGSANSLDDLRVVANDRTISIFHAGQMAEGTRDRLLATVRAASSYEDLWTALTTRKDLIN